MWQWFRSFFQRRGKNPPEGFVLRDAAVDASVDSILKSVALQLAAAQSTPEQLNANQSAILGYIAAMADIESKKLKGHNQRAAAVLISILVAGKLAGKSADHESLMSEFSALEEARDFDYGQGGAMALEDCASSARGTVPHALTLWIKQSGNQRAAG